MALLSSSKKATTLAPALPINNEAFQQHRLVLRQGQFTILAAAPSVGKSLFARNLVSNTIIPSMFLSADSDEYTVKTTVAASMTGMKIAQVEEYLADDGWDAYFNEELGKVNHVEWAYSPDINIDVIVDRLNAYNTTYGDYPKLLVIDNLGDMVTEDGEEYAELRVICRELRKIARYSAVHILALHHCKGEYEDGMKPITLKSLLGNLGRVPENVLGLNWATPDGKTVQMTVPKNRGGVRGATVLLPVDYTTGTLGGFVRAAA